MTTRFKADNVRLMGVRLLVGRHEVLTYALFAYAITWLASIPLILTHYGAAGVHVSKELEPLGALGPVSAALLVAVIARGRKRSRALPSGIRDSRNAYGWLVLAALSMPAIFGLSAILARIAGASWPEFRQLGQVDGFPAIGWLGGWLMQVFVQGLGEESGWRGFALPRLQSSRTALQATIVIWLMWAIWHVPYFIYKDTYSFAPLALFGFLVSLYPGAIILTWFYNSSRGSIFAAALFHGGVNFTLGSAAADGHPVQGVITAILFIWAIAVIRVCKAADLSFEKKVTVGPPVRNGVGIRPKQ